jgi:hypothetical protein
MLERFAEHRFNPEKETRSHGWPASISFGTAQDDPLCPHCRRQIMRGKANVPLKSRHSERAPDTRCQPWVWLNQLRPRSFIQAGSYDEISKLQPCLK